jgi:hypothetical protein
MIGFPLQRVNRLYNCSVLYLSIGIMLSFISPANLILAQEVRPGGFNRPRITPLKAGERPQPEFYGRCVRDFDGRLACLKVPGKGVSQCQSGRECYPQTPTPTPTPRLIPSPTPTPRYSCICACRASDSSKELLCSVPFVYRVSRLGNICPDKESGWYPWSFERDVYEVPAQRGTSYCGDRWDGRIGQGYSEKSPKGPPSDCFLEQCREGILRRSW